MKIDGKIDIHSKNSKNIFRPAKEALRGLNKSCVVYGDIRSINISNKNK